MTTEIIFSTNKLGSITDAQLQQVIKRFELGKLISSKRTEKGAMGQTLFITTSKGKFVLKGNPLYKGQLEEERYFVEQLHQKTNVIMPFPFLIDDKEDIFGWKYALMPYLPGEHMNSEDFKSKLNLENGYKIAEELAKALAQFHNWKVEYFGELNTEDFTIRPFNEPYRDWIFNRIRYWLEDAKKYSVITKEDTEWVEELFLDSKPAFDEFNTPSFAMGDFKPENFRIKKGTTGWEIGVFDFTNAYFGDPLADLIKMITMYINNEELEIAKHFLTNYLNRMDCDSNSYKKRIKVHMLHQRILDWGCAKAMGFFTWDDNLQFSKWVNNYTETAANLID